MEDKGRNGKHEVFTVNVKKKRSMLISPTTFNLPLNRLDAHTSYYNRLDV